MHNHYLNSHPKTSFIIECVWQHIYLHKKTLLILLFPYNNVIHIEIIFDDMIYELFKFPWENPLRHLYTWFRVPCKVIFLTESIFFVFQFFLFFFFCVADDSSVGSRIYLEMENVICIVVAVVASIYCCAAL